MGNTQSTGEAYRRESPRNWRLAAFGTGCTIIGGACVLLAACSTNPGKSSLPQALPELASPSVPELLPAEHATTSATAPLWARLREGFALPDCDYNAQVTQWSRRFSRDAAGFTASLNQAMPFLLVVADEIERRGIPAEFVFLPYIESNYTALASSGDRAAGIWQLMPDTAREAGLSITHEYDGRLDVQASTTIALDLLEHYHEEFGDWRLVDMAFNFGEYGIKDLRGGNSDAPSADELARLHVPAHAHEHMAKLLAVSCIVADPERFQVELPEPQAEDALAALELPAPVDLTLIARVVGIDVAQLKQLNPGYLRGRMPERGPFHLLLPAARHDSVAALLDKLPPAAWREWREIALQHDEDIGVLAAAHGVDVDALRALNAANGDTIPAGTHLLVPGHADERHAPAAIAKVEDLIERSSLHIVHAGDTLWSIAHRAGVRIADLLSWNGLHSDATLHLGQRLRLQPPGVSTASSASAP